MDFQLPEGVAHSMLYQGRLTKDDILNNKLPLIQQVGCKVPK